TERLFIFALRGERLLELRARDELRRHQQLAEAQLVRAVRRFDADDRAVFDVEGDRLLAVDEAEHARELLKGDEVQRFADPFVGQCALQRHDAIFRVEMNTNNTIKLALTITLIIGPGTSTPRAWTSGATPSSQ